jgi:hypothetical protein
MTSRRLFRCCSPVIVTIVPPRRAVPHSFEVESGLCNQIIDMSSQERNHVVMGCDGLPPSLCSARAECRMSSSTACTTASVG